jgi:hypothetical protein
MKASHWSSERSASGSQRLSTLLLLYNVIHRTDKDLQLLFDKILLGVKEKQGKLISGKNFFSTIQRNGTKY